MTRSIDATPAAKDGTASPVSALPARTLSEASALLRAKKVSAVELTQACLARVERFDKALNSFITLTAERALLEARKAEAEIGQGKWRGPLHGIPIALKDLVDTAGVRTTAGSALFADRIPERDAEVVRLLREAGAIFLGKLNMHELAYGASTVISASGPVCNPWATNLIAGGSSAGSAAAVAAGLCYGAVGSDTGGSIREPASYCGIVGLKPTYGGVSTAGVVPLAWSLDHLGPMTRTVGDAALMLEGMNGRELATPKAPAIRGLRLGLPRPYFYEELDPEVKSAVDAAIAVLTGLGASPKDVEIETGNDAALPVLRAEAYAFHKDHVARTPERYHPETLKRLKGGADLLAADYIVARRRVEELRQGTPALFAGVDLLVTPTSPVLPMPIADLLADLESLRPREIKMLRNVRPFNALGLPSLSMPCGFTSRGLPIGIQITGPAGAEAGVLELAQAYEAATDWHTREPRGFETR